MGFQSKSPQKCADLDEILSQDVYKTAKAKKSQDASEERKQHKRWGELAYL